MIPEYRQALEEDAARIRTRLATRLEERAPQGGRLVNAMRHSLLNGGKRLRPILCLWVGESLLEERPAELWRAALALEMVHSYSLVHDDLPAMDDDDLRRGQPSCHKAFDEATAILAGDTLQSEAFALLAEVGDATLARELSGRLARALGLGGMAEGQQLDLLAHKGLEDADQMRRIHRLKTGRLLGAAIAMGAACGKATSNQIRDLARAGEDLGLAFQLVDDLLDESADPARLGKSVGKDREQGKLSALSVMDAAAARTEAEELLAGALQVFASAGLSGGKLEALLVHLIRRDH